MTTTLRVTRAIVALLVIACVVVGGAWALVRFGRLDILTSIDWGALWTTVDDGTLVLGVITLIGWFAWCMATLSLVNELLAVLTSQRWRLSLPGLGVFAPASTVLVTAIVGLVVSQSVAPAAAHAAPILDAPAAPTAMTVPDDQRMKAEGRAAAVAPDTHIHVVRAGDDLWSLAEEHYGDGARWREIAGANQTVLLDSTDFLEPGMVLAIPHASRPEPGPGVVVQPGDSLSSLAATHLGDAQRWPELARANPELVDDPDLIDVGWVLALPDAGPGPAAGQADTLTEPTATDLGPGQPAEVLAVSVSSPFTSCPVPAAHTSDRSTTTTERTAWAAALPSSFGTLLATGLAGVYLLRRRQQLAGRPLGRRLPALPESASATCAGLLAAHDEARVAGPTEVPTVTSVTLGDSDRGSVWCDLEHNAVTWLQADHGDDVAMATAIALSLACSPGLQPVGVVLAGPPFGWLTSLDEPGLVILDEPDDGLGLLEETLCARAGSLPEGTTVGQLRADPTRADAWAPLVVVLSAPPSRGLSGSLGLLGVSVVICGGSQAAQVPAATVRVHAELGEYAGQTFAPHLVNAPARRVLTEIFATANQTDYPPAPWWDDTPDSELPTVLRVAAWPGSVEELPVVSTIESDHPVVKLLGPVELVGARGEIPARAVKQCQEYCAWLLENPGASPVAMTQALLVAEPTRRSNMSRLRSWLGTDPNGDAYLPDAYSGRIMLHPGVTSDWEQLQLRVSGGVNRVSDAALVEALNLVRGTPLADAAPGQWHWAEQLRADITAMITDIAVVLGRRALEVGNLQLAQWAVDRAMLTSPDDELLLGVQIRIAHAVEDHTQVDRLVLQTIRRARMLGVDLADETVTLLQEVVEGRARLRRA